MSHLPTSDDSYRDEHDQGCRRRRRRRTRRSRGRDGTPGSPGHLGQAPGGGWGGKSILSANQRPSLKLLTSLPIAAFILTIVQIAALGLAIFLLVCCVGEGCLLHDVISRRRSEYTALYSVHCTVLSTLYCTQYSHKTMLSLNCKTIKVI